MALFINVDPVPARWWKRKVHRGWQFGYSGGTENDFMIDIEIAKWRFVCYIGFKKVQNWAPGYEKHLKWRKEQELARKRVNKPESAFKRFWRSLRRTKTATNRVDQKHSGHNQALTHTRFELVANNQLRQWIAETDSHNERRRLMATRAGLPESVYGTTAASIKGELLHEEHQGPASDHAHHQNSEAGELSEGAD